MKNFILITLILGSLQARAGAILEMNQSIRSLGMGGVYTAIVNNTDALFYNPAALARVEGLQWHVANADVAINGLDILNDVKSVSSVSTPSDYNQFFGKDIWLRAGGTTALAMPYFGVGAYSDSQADLQLHNPAFPQFDTNFTSDYGLVVGGAVPLGPVSSAGIVAKRITRWGGDQNIDLGTIASGSTSNIASQFKDKGNGYGLDLGVMTTIPAPFNPTIALTWQDLGCTAFQMTSGTEAPPRIKDNLSLGVGTSFSVPGMDWYTGFEYRHITDTDYQLGQKIDLGTELSLPLLDIRGGIHQGYAAYGLGMHILFFQFDVASYTEETGAYPGQSPQSRVQVGVSVDLTFDPDFKLVDADGKKRKMKERR